MKVLFLLILISFVQSTYAGETAGGTSRQKAGDSGLPLCVKDTVSILATEKANKDNDFKYQGFIAALSGVSDDELVARLAYSETLAANCPEQNSKILPFIKAAIENRVRVKKSARKTVFQRQAFSSSLNDYPESRYKDFLCPEDATLWRQALEPASTSLPSDIYHYYLYMNAPKRFSPKGGAAGSGIDLGQPQAFVDCIRFRREAL